jgi:hypothetical protein
MMTERKSMAISDNFKATAYFAAAAANNNNNNNNNNNTL